MLTQTNPLHALHKEYDQALLKARDYIIENCFWSISTYYYKMNHCKRKLTDHENDVIATAFKLYINPVIEIFNTSQN